MKSATPPQSTTAFPEIANLAIQNNILTQAQVHDALHKIAEEKAKGRILTFEDYLHESRLVSEETLSRLIAATVRHLDKKLGALAVQQGVLDQETVDKALAAQKKAFAQGVLKPVGDILMAWNRLTSKQRDDLLQAITLQVLPSEEDKPPPISDTQTHDQKQANAPPTAPKTQAGSILQDDEKDEDSAAPMTIDIGGKGMKAVLIIHGDLDAAPSLTSVKELIKQYDISHGLIQDSELSLHLAKAGKEPLTLIVARGQEAVQGKSSEIKLHFNNDYLNPGEITEDGTIDFRERGSVPFVSEGTLIAVKTPAVKGTQGKDIFGQVVPVDDVEDLSLKAGAGTRASDDGLSIYATTEGQPFMSVQGEVCVFKDLHIKGDVDYSTGNISFDGNIFVKGSIKEGFTIKGGSLTARDVQGATLDIKGNINISGGIIDSFITIGGSLQAMYMANTKVDAYGDILIKKEIIDSKIRSSGVFSGDQLNVISSFVSAKQGIAVKRIGTDVSEPCTIRIGISDHTNKIIKNLKSELEEAKRALEEKQTAGDKLKAALKKSQQEIMEKAVTQDRLNNQKKAVENRIKEISEDLEKTEESRKLTMLLSQTESEIKGLEDVMAKLFDQQEQLTNTILPIQKQYETLVREIEAANIRIKDVKTWDKKTNQQPQVRTIKEIHPQTAITAPNSTLVVREILKNVTIREIKKTENGSLIWSLVVESN